MAKFYGKVGYGVIQEPSVTEQDAVSEDYSQNPDICQEHISERSYYGDVFKDSRQLEKGYGVNDNIKVNNRISILADAYAFEHFFAIRYVRWMGTRWKVSDVEVQRPRLILSIGDVYNGPEIDTV